METEVREKGGRQRTDQTQVSTVLQPLAGWGAGPALGELLWPAFFSWPLGRDLTVVRLCLSGQAWLQTWVRLGPCLH